MTTKREYQKRAHTYAALQALGFTYDECEAMRRISMTLRRWHEAECNGDIQRDDATGQCFRQYGGGAGPFLTVKTADKETAARKRLHAIVKRVNVQRAGKVGKLASYIQGDPRGAALYILRPGDVPAGADAGSYYSRGICVY